MANSMLSSSLIQVDVNGGRRNSTSEYGNWIIALCFDHVLSLNLHNHYKPVKNVKLITFNCLLATSSHKREQCGN